MRRKHVAIHEAGHAIVACGLHLKVTGAEVFDDGPRLGFGDGYFAGVVRTRHFDRNDTPSAVAEIAFSLAGVVAESLYYDDFEQVLTCDDLRDRHSVEMFAERCETMDLHSAERVALAAYPEHLAWSKIWQSWQRVARWQRLPNVAEAIAELATDLDRLGQISDVYAYATRHKVRTRDRRLLPRGGAFFDARLREHVSQPLTANRGQ